LPIIRVNARGGSWIVKAKESVKRGGPALGDGGQAGAQRLMPARSRREAVEKRTQIEAGSTSDDRQTSSGPDRFEGVPREPGVRARRQFPVDGNDVDQMVRYAAPRSRGNLGGPDIHSLIDLNRIAVEDLSVQSFSEEQCKLAFAGASRPEHGDQRPQSEVRIGVQGLICCSDRGNAETSRSIRYFESYTRCERLDPSFQTPHRSGRMPYPHFKSLRATCLRIAALTVLPVLSLAAAQTPEQKTPNTVPALPAPSKQASSPKAAAYYHFALGHLYEELAGVYGNRSDYVTRAIDNYRLAIKDDPTATFLVEEIADLYRAAGHTREAVEEAENALKANPDDLNARRLLARIYTQDIGDAQANHIDDAMVRRAIEQYKIITEKDPKDVDSLVWLGRLERIAENSVDAEAAFKKVLAIDPENDDAITGLASVYSDRGDARTASGLLEKLTKKNPSARAYSILAGDYESMHEYSLAADAYKKALELDPSRMELKAALAQDEAVAGRYDEALKTYQEIADANPQDAQPYLGMAQIYREQKNFALAHQMIDKAKELDPDDLDIRYSEVSVLEAEGKNTEAIAKLKELLDTTAHRGTAEADRSVRAKMLEQLGLLYRENEQYDQAVDTFRQLAELNPDLAGRAEAQIIDTYRLAKDYTKAQQESDAAGKKYPNDRILEEVRAQLLADEGKTDLAITELKKLLDGKNDRETYIAMAEVYEKGKNFPDMGKALDAAEKLSQSKEDRVNVLFLRGEMYERQKKYDAAEKTFRQVIDLDPTSAEAMNYLGYMLADQNVKLQEAQDLIKRAVNLDPNNYAYLDSLGWVYYRLNRLDDAVQQLTRSLQIKSSDPTIHDHLGDVYFKQGKIKDAIAQWQSSLKQWNSSSPADIEPEEVAKVQKKLDSARLRLAQEQGPKGSDPPVKP
jgi:tetratricopeptide (TPR) repeat protein